MSGLHLFLIQVLKYKVATIAIDRHKNNTTEISTVIYARADDSHLSAASKH